MNRKKMFKQLFEYAQNIALPEEDIQNAKELFEYNEFGLSLDTIITQVYEYEIAIDQQFYNLVENIAKMLHVDDSEYSCLKELIK